LKQSVSELIAMDVQRSFHSFRHIVKPEILNNILKTYAFFNPEIEYCQGMNFVAGFLFLVFRDEELSFKALMRVAETFDMSHLYKKELPKLKLFFYTLDRLMSIQLPLLHQHFKDEQITAGIFASAWFITQFTNSL
jgi:ecotropic viral integration site 5 protein